MKLRKIVLTIMVGATLPLSACNLPSGTGGIDLERAAALTVEAELALRQEQEAAAPTAAPATATEEPPAETEVPPTETEVPATEPPEAPTATVEAAGCTDRARFVSDVTYPDDTEVGAGAAFEKVWRLRNDGSCTWTSSYALVFDHGDAMSGSPAVPFSGSVPPGSTVDLSIDLTAPGSPGEYQGFYKLRNNAGVLFGIGDQADIAFWVKIDVPSSTPEPTATGFVLIPNITLIPLLYYSSGQDQTLLDGACFDLDEGDSVGCGAGQADFSFQPELLASDGFPVTFEFVQHVDPRHGMELRYAGSEAPTKADCEGMNLGGSAIDVDPGRYYCYQTSEDRFGWIHIDSADQISLRLDWATFQ